MKTSRLGNNDLEAKVHEERREGMPEWKARQQEEAKKDLEALKKRFPENFKDGGGQSGQTSDYAYKN